MKKVLFLTHEGIDSSIFNSQVLTHALTMRDLGVSIDILAFNTNNKSKLNSIKNYNRILNKNFDVRVILKFGLNIFIPFSSIFNGLLLIIFLQKNKNNYSVIHCRSDYTTFVGLLTKFIHGKKVIWDCRGDSVNELNETLSKKSLLLKLLGKIYFIPINLLEVWFASKFSDSAIFVSNSLYNKYSENLKTNNWKIIPCPVLETKFFFNEQLRLLYREKHNIKDDEYVFLYSGSLASYQALNLQEEFYYKLLKSSKNKIIFATVDVFEAKKNFDSKFSNNFEIINVSFDEMNNYYNLADFAILLRDFKPFNNVASPTKFGEYCLTGLPVIMNDSIDQSMQYSKELGNYINFSTLKFKKIDNSKRKIISHNARKYFSRNELNKQYFQLYESLI
jgi:hypothetical protein